MPPSSRTASVWTSPPPSLSGRSALRALEDLGRQPQDFDNPLGGGPEPREVGAQKAPLARILSSERRSLRHDQSIH